MLLAAAEAKGRKPSARVLQWSLKDAGDAGHAYLVIAGCPSTRQVQRHLKAIRAQTFQHVAQSVSVGRAEVVTLGSMKSAPESR